MPKMKTKKNVSKKFKVTGTGKLKRRSTGQNHYNTRDTGKATRAKRADHVVTAVDVKNVKRALLQS
jgi:large subunit ribosomal protein L35